MSKLTTHQPIPERTHSIKPVWEYYNESGDSAIPCPIAAKCVPDMDQLREFVEHVSNLGIEITMTFLPELAQKYHPSTLSVMVEDAFLRYKKRYDFNVVLVGEYSPTGMYHFHGSLAAPVRMINSIRRNFPRTFGRTELKMIRHTEAWAAYVLKAHNDDTSIKELEPHDVIIIKANN